VNEGPAVVRDTGSDPGAAALARRVLVRVVGTLLAISILAGLAGAYFSGPLLQVSRGFVYTFGGWGILVGWTIADATILPVPHDVLTTFGLLGGLPLWEVVAWASAGTWLGSSAGFAIGRFLSHTTFFRRIVERRGPEVFALAGRYGVGVMVFAALGPIMYSLSCWAGGALGVSWRSFFLVTLLRVPRIIVYLWAIQAGYLTVVQP
jgi:membrane protein YqaA with SNARE-associated domain